MFSSSFFKFTPRPLFDFSTVKDYIILYKDNDNNYQCHTNLYDPIVIAGYKELLNTYFSNSFYDRGKVNSEKSSCNVE